MAMEGKMKMPLYATPFRVSIQLSFYMSSKHNICFSDNGTLARDAYTARQIKLQLNNNSPNAITECSARKAVQIKNI